MPGVWLMNKGVPKGFREAAASIRGAEKASAGSLGHSPRSWEPRRRAASLRLGGQTPTGPGWDEGAPRPGLQSPPARPGGRVPGLGGGPRIPVTKQPGAAPGQTPHLPSCNSELVSYDHLPAPGFAPRSQRPRVGCVYPFAFTDGETASESLSRPPELAQLTGSLP